MFMERRADLGLAPAEIERRLDWPPGRLAEIESARFGTPRETVRIIMRFADVPDPSTPYVYHCQSLEPRGQRHDGTVRCCLSVELGAPVAPPCIAGPGNANSTR
jgi:hypothetical protein